MLIGQWPFNLPQFWGNNDDIFCKFNTEHSWERFEIEKHYDQWSMPNHKRVLWKQEKEIRMHHMGRGNSSEQLYRLLYGPAGLLCSSVSIFSWKIRHSISPNSIRSLPGFHQSGHPAKSPMTLETVPSWWLPPQSVCKAHLKYISPFTAHLNFIPLVIEL